MVAIGTEINTIGTIAIIITMAAIMVAGATTEAVIITAEEATAEAVITEIELFLCRHGETAWTISRQHTGVSDIPLTESGKEQAVLLGKRLQSIQFDKILSSPKQRALETARLAMGQEPLLEPKAIEWNYGLYEGLTSLEIAQQDPSWTLFSKGAPQGESIEQISARADQLLHHLKSLQGKIVLFSHGHFSRVLAARWLGLPAQIGQSFYLSVASFSILGFERKQPVLKLWNDTSHLCE